MEIKYVETLILGSGAAGLNAAVQLKRLGHDDLAVLSEGLNQGTSINTGSDKQTYYKLSLCDEPDSPRQMAQTYFDGGSMHGDLALAESAGSVRGFMNLVALGVPFPHDGFGRYIGYKTDHDPARRATSVGPYTSREMCRALIKELTRLEIPVLAPYRAIEILTETADPAAPSDRSAFSDRSARSRRVIGVVALDENSELVGIACRNLVFAVGGPAGIYRTSVYPVQQTGAIGLALAAGATAENLAESQFGLASLAPRWNVSGTYMQAIPRFVSFETDARGNLMGAGREFLSESIVPNGPNEQSELRRLFSDVFRKGYQWPFDSRKIPDGSSRIDLMVYEETVLKGRRVFLDFTRNPARFSFDLLDAEAREYLEKSGATQPTPLDRLTHMNPGAVQLYQDFGVDLGRENLEIALCAQHNNGGLAVDIWWESVNVSGLFPVGEVAGTHGAARPGGSALNAGQVGSLRAAQRISVRLRDEKRNSTSVSSNVQARFEASVRRWKSYFQTCQASSVDWQTDRAEFQGRMSALGAAIRKTADLPEAVDAARRQYEEIASRGGRFLAGFAYQAAENVQLALTHWFYLEAALYALKSGVGSRGSALLIDESGEKISENEAFRQKVEQTWRNEQTGTVDCRWIERRPIPEQPTWFETDWAKFRSGDVFREPQPCGVN